MQSSAAVPRPVIDREQLHQATLGNADLQREVLEMFIAQAGRIVAGLADRPADGGALAHTLVGSARAIGAARVAEASAALEQVVRQNGDPQEALATLDRAVGEACDAIRDILQGN